jgi:adenine deaminase
MDRVVRHAIEQGVPTIMAIQMATINTAEHFMIDRELGMIAPGRYGDVLVVPDLEKFVPEMVFAKGKLVAQGGKLEIDLPAYPYPDWATTSIHLGKQAAPTDFEIKAPLDSGTVKANVIGVIENQAPTQHLTIDVMVENGKVKASIDQDLAKIALVERHKGTGGIQLGLVSGFGFDKPCGIATSVAHDSHHMIVVGTDDSDMAMAVNELARVNGGQVVVSEGKVLGMVELPIAGLMSNERAEVVSEKTATVLEGFLACGSTLNNPNMQMSLLALVVIPELRLSDLGLVDVTKFEFIPLFETE